MVPFIIAATSLVHIAALHQYGSNNPLGTHSGIDKIAFYPYFYVKDLVGWLGFALFFFFLVYFYPNLLGHPDNYIPANPMSTPAHIVPEWYFLWVYAILRSIPNKLGGVAAIALVFIALLALPFINTAQTRSSTFRPIHKKLFWLLVADCVILVSDWSTTCGRPLHLDRTISDCLFFPLFPSVYPFLGSILKKKLIEYKTNQNILVDHAVTA